MYGGGLYSLESVKEITVTDGFKSLREDQKQCQSYESFEKCSTDSVMKKILQTCNCYPYELKVFSANNAVTNIFGIPCFFFIQNIFSPKPLGSSLQYH